MALALNHLLLRKACRYSSRRALFYLSFYKPMNNPLLNYLKTIQKAVVYSAHYLKQIADRDKYLSSIEDQLCDLYTLMAEEVPPYINSDEYWEAETLKFATMYLPQLIQQHPSTELQELADMSLDTGILLANALKQSFESKFPTKN